MVVLWPGCAAGLGICKACGFHKDYLYIMVGYRLLYLTGAGLISIGLKELQPYSISSSHSCCACVFTGTGASCIYPLLGATMNGWYFLATEVDDICFDYATKNVEQNNLSELIKGKPSPLSPLH
jgi:hypothetical protein